MKYTEEMILHSSGYCMPFEAPQGEDVELSLGYGEQTHPETGEKFFHHGIDFSVRCRMLSAVADGIVSGVGNDAAHGICQTIRYGEYEVTYGHLSNVFAQFGQRVKAGQTVALSGEWLHLEVRFKGEEMVEYSTSPGGILSLMASSMQPLADPYQVLKATGEWNSKTTEDYIEMCKAEIAGSEAMQQDLAYMAERWREAVVQEVGRERYDELSRELGYDLAYAFVDYRVEQLMIGRLVEERMPKSSSEYIVRKAAESSLLGLTQTLSRSPLAEEIERRGEAAYRPSKIEKGAAKVLGVSADAVMLGGAGSWTALARFVGMDAAVSAVASRLWPEGPEPLSAELCISKGVFDSDDNVFEGFRREAAAIPAAENALVSEANGRLRNKIPVVSYDLAGWWKPGAEYQPARS